MHGEQAHQFGTGIAARPRDADAQAVVRHLSVRLHVESPAHGFTPTAFPRKSEASRRNEKGRSSRNAPSQDRGFPGQRFENWKLRRALARPYFLRSTLRASRVR